MAPLVVDPEALFAAGSAVVAAGDGLAANLSVLTAGFAAHTGLDVAGMVFGLAYQDAAGSLLKAAAAAINACRCSGALMQVGASNYSKAEAASTLGGGTGVLQAPGEPVKITASGPPGTLGPGEPPPLLWALVQSLVDDVWPDGDVAGLHAAAARWRSFGAAASGMQGALNASKSLVGAQQIAEGGKIDEALSEIGTNIASIGEQCGKLAATLDDFANEVDHAQNAIRDLLHRLGSLADLAHDVVLIFDGDAIDEIKRIAEDINAVLHNLGREARAYEQGTKVVMQVGDGLVVKFEKYMRREFIHFLGEDVGNPVATVFDTWVNANEGVVKGAVGMVQGMVELDPRRFLIDPEGAAATWKGMFKGSVLDMLLHPDEGTEANLQNWKSLLHLDDWSTARPGLGFGENLFDVGMLFLPGAGEAGGVAEGAGAGARGAEAAADAAGTAERAGGRAAGGLGGIAGARGALADIAGTGSGLTKDLEDVTGNLPKVDRPLGGRPVALPEPKPLEAPVEPAPRPAESAPTTQSPAAPNGLADPGRPTTPGGRHDAPPAPAAGPHAPLSTPPSGPHDPLSGPHDPAPGPAAPAEQLKSTSPLRAGPATTHMSVPSAGSSVEPAHAAVRLPQPSSSVPYAAPHASSPDFTPSDGRPAELTTMHGDDPYRHGHGDRPHQLPPHDGSPHGPNEVDPSELDPPEPPAEDEASGRQDDQPVEPAEPPIADPEDAGEIRHAISGHGSYFPAHGHIHVPRGTTI
ncbi:MAG: hypothetical protein WAO15_08975, partial [Mycobacterium sp.]